LVRPRAQSPAEILLVGSAAGDFGKPVRAADIDVRLYCSRFGARIAVFAGSLWALRRSRLQLPVRFRGFGAAQAHEAGTSPDFSLLIARLIVTSLILVTLFGFLVEYAALSAQVHGRLHIFNWPAGYSVWDWIQVTYGPVVVGLCALRILGAAAGQPGGDRRHLCRTNYGIAILLPLGIVLAPRLAQVFLFAASGRGDLNYSPTWREMLDPDHSFPWVFAIFVTAWLIEFVLRRCIQEPLTKLLGLKRAVYLTALIWWVLPILKGFGPIPRFVPGVPGEADVLSLLIIILYNLPLAWLYARTRSLWLVTLMHARMLLFHTGTSSHHFYRDHSNFYWIETSAWIVASWYLFHKYPADSSAQSPSQAALDAGPSLTTA
jgi:hypothetical protein